MTHLVPPQEVRKNVSDEEWETRVALAACYRLMDRYGMSDMVYNHITARIPGTEEILINAYGYLYSEIQASNLIKISLDGTILLQPESPYGYGVNPAGAVIHTAVHTNRPDVQCVIHTHTRAGMAVSAMKCGLLPITQTALRFHGRVGYHDFDSPIVDPAQQPELVKSLGSNEVVILRNHGLLVVGLTIPQAFNSIYWLEMACKAQVDAMSTGAELLVPPEVYQQQTGEWIGAGKSRPFGIMEWPAMLRLAERIDPSYKE